MRAKPVVVTALAAAAGTAVVLAWRRRRSAVAAVAQRSTFARTSRLARVGASAGSSYAVHRARRVFASAERAEALDTAFEIKTAEQVAEALGQMKGAVMKLGQMVSYLDQGLPEHVRTALAELQQDAPPMSAELAAGVIVVELGKEPADLFAEWDPRPIASASIGQVHRAITRDGRAVAVKVQYPGVADAVGSDLDSVGLLFAGVGQLFPGLDHKALVAELRERLVEELDYENEARNQSVFADAYRDHPFIHVPSVVPECSTARVLTTELAEGVPWNELLTWDQRERDLAAEAIYRFAFGSLYRLRIFNGDPHPGNYLFRKGGRVTFLDFGLCRHFTAAELQPFEDMIRAMVQEPDRAEFRRITEAVGLLPAGAPFTDDEIHEYFGHFYEFLQRDDDYTITPEYASETVRRYFDQRGPYGDIMRSVNLPPSFVIIQRINLGLYALFGELHATGNWRRLAEELWPWVAGPPSTPMGETIAAWSGPAQPEWLTGFPLSRRSGCSLPLAGAWVSPLGPRRRLTLVAAVIGSRVTGCVADGRTGSTRHYPGQMAESTRAGWVRRDVDVVWHGFTQMSTFADNQPVIVDRAEGHELIDVDGNRYLDAISSLWVTTLGHHVPELDQAARDQLDKVAHTTLLGNGNVATIELAEALARRVPVRSPHFLFVSDGAAATEQALKIAFQHWVNLGVAGRTSYLTLGGAYHGDTTGAISLGAGGFGTDLFDPLRFAVHRAPGYDDPDWDELAVKIIDRDADELAAVVLEPLVQGAAGIEVTDGPKVRRVAEAAEAAGVLVVADEVATGFGRTGTLFASEQCGIHPDLLCIGKGLTGGYLPLSATVVTDHVYRSFLGPDLGERTFYHGHSFSGNALGCAVATRHLQLFDELDVLANVNERALELGALLDRDIAPLGEVAAVRRRGLMTGVELAPPGPDLRWGRLVCAAAVRRGVLLRPLGDVVVVMPLLTSTSEEIARIVATLRDAILEVGRAGPSGPSSGTAAPG